MYQWYFQQELNVLSTGVEMPSVLSTRGVELMRSTCTALTKVLVRMPRPSRPAEAGVVLRARFALEKFTLTLTLTAPALVVRGCTLERFKLKAPRFISQSNFETGRFQARASLHIVPPHLIADIADIFVGYGPTTISPVGGGNRRYTSGE